MKILLSTLLPFFFAAVLAAQPANPPHRPSSLPSPPADLAALEQFLNLSEDELAEAEKVIVRLRAMTPAQRAELREKMKAYRQLPEPQRQHLRQGWGALPPHLQESWREMMQTATPERRAEIQGTLQSLRPEEKGTYRRRLAQEFLDRKAAKE